MPNAKENSNIKTNGKKVSHKMEVETNSRSWAFTQHIYDDNRDGDEDVYGKWKIKEKRFH